MFGWFRKKKPKERVYPYKMKDEYLREILYTTARNRMGYYCDWGIGYSAVDHIYCRVYDRVKDMWIVNDRVFFDCVVRIFEQEEERERRYHAELAKEYGM